MYVRLWFAWLVLALFLAGSTLPSQAAEPAAVPGAPPADGVSAGGGYRVVAASAQAATVMLAQATGAAGGGQYRLGPVPVLRPADVSAQAAGSAAGSAAGCCCIYYPRVRR